MRAGWVLTVGHWAVSTIALATGYVRPMRRRHTVHATTCLKVQIVRSAPTRPAVLDAAVTAPACGKTISTPRVSVTRRGEAAIVKNWWVLLAPTIARATAVASTKLASATTCTREKAAKVPRRTLSISIQLCAGNGSTMFLQTIVVRDKGLV